MRERLAFQKAQLDSKLKQELEIKFTLPKQFQQIMWKFSTTH